MSSRILSNQIHQALKPHGMGLLDDLYIHNVGGGTNYIMQVEAARMFSNLSRADVTQVLRILEESFNITPSMLSQAIHETPQVNGDGDILIWIDREKLEALFPILKESAEVHDP